MKSQKLTAYGEPLVELEEPTPDPTGTEVIVKVSYCGVCHSDLHIHDGYFELSNGRKLDTSRNRSLPFTLGHEIQGDVVAVGPDTTGVEVGQKCVVYPWGGCGDCAHCRRGFENLCEAGLNLGAAQNGGYADYVVVPHSRHILDATGIANGLAGTYMCSGLTAYSAFQKIGDLDENDVVLIIGVGGVGLMGVQIAQAIFANAPFAADIDPAKRAAALKFGAAAVYDSSDDKAVKTIRSDTNGGVYAVVDFVGSEASITFARKCLRRGGKLIVVGLFGGGLSIDLPLIPLTQLAIIGSITGTLDEAKEVLELAKQGIIDPIPIEQRPLDDANAVLDDLRAGRIVGRVVLTP